MRDSLWSIDLFRCESATLKSHWVLLVMDQYTRRIIGFTIHVGIVDGPALCRMFNRAVRGQSLPRFLSSDHDPLYQFRRWRANLRIREITEVKTIPYVPRSHPFVERPTTIRPIVGRLPSITPFTPCMATSSY
jgi:transposase InsO family protein